MDIKQRTWTVERLLDEQEHINLNPIWQRGPAWKVARQALLIDSILRGMDMPKIYVRRLGPGSAYKYDVVDGQQRLRAIWEFAAGRVALNHPETLPPIDGHAIDGLKFAQLHRDLRTRFSKFKVSIAEIVAASSDEISNLFSRLQMGVSLNPAELRNAIQGPMRHVIDAIATSHEFFLNSKIPDSRYKRQDYCAHAFALAAYDGAGNMKAPDLKRMVKEFGADRALEVMECSRKVGDALNVLTQVNELANRQLTQKWLFVDLCWLIMQHQGRGRIVAPDRVAARYAKFETRRREFNSKPEDLIRSKGANPTLDRHLYDYIIAFRAQGGLNANLKRRNQALRAFFTAITQV